LLKVISNWPITERYFSQPMRERDLIASEWNPASLLIALNFRVILFRLLNSNPWLMRSESYPIQWLTIQWIEYDSFSWLSMQILIDDSWHSFIKVCSLGWMHNTNGTLSKKMHLKKMLFETASGFEIIIFGLNQAWKRGFGPVQTNSNKDHISGPEMVHMWTGNGPCFNYPKNRDCWIMSDSSIKSLKYKYRNCLGPQRFMIRSITTTVVLRIPATPIQYVPTPTYHKRAEFRNVC